MTLTLERAKAITQQRDEALMAGDLDSYMDLWADACLVEGPAHCLRGRAELRAQLEAALAQMQVLQMLTRSLAVQDDAMYYEFAILWEVRASGDRVLHTGMTYHQVDSNCRFTQCREYFDPPGQARRTAAELPEIAGLLQL